MAKKTKNSLLMSIITFRWPLWFVFPSSFGCPLPLGFSHPFTFRSQLYYRKNNKEVNFVLNETRFEHTTMESQSKCTTNSTNTCFVIIPIILWLHYHGSHSMYNIKRYTPLKHHTINIHRTWTQVLSENQYSQPFEQVLFHIKTINIKCHKGFYYPPLLNNYLFNYLNFSGLIAAATYYTDHSTENERLRQQVEQTQKNH